MNKKILAVCLCFVIACGIFAGCKKKAAEPVSIIVTDENGVAVTDAKGEIVTKIATPATDKKGNVVTEKATNAKGEVITDADGNAKTVVVTVPESTNESGSESTSAAQTTTTKKSGGSANEKVPYSTTAPENNKTLDEWTFGNAAKVGCIAPNGWSNETVNQVVKDGTETRVQICPVNYLAGAGYKTADDYAKFIQELSHGKDSGSKQLSYSKEVYDDGMGIAILYEEKTDNKDDAGYYYGKYHMIYLFQTGDRVRTYFVYGVSEAEARTDIGDVIANTYYRG